jgi:soluble lytic murein transglycosylase
VDDLLRGIVDYYAGAYDPGIAALERAVANPAQSADALYYLGLSYLASDEPAQAADALQSVIEDYPESPHWGDAWMEWAEALADQDDVAGAVATYQGFAAAAPGHMRAPEALWAAAQLLERVGQLKEAAVAYEACREAYPSSENAAPALLRAGLQHYREGAIDQALTDWTVLAEQYANSDYRAGGYFWLGKAYLAAGQPISATAAFQRAIDVDPDGYYGLRAFDLVADPLARPFQPTAYDVTIDLAAGQTEAERWLADWLGLPSTEDLGTADEELAADPHLRRGLELWDLGQYEVARGELETLRQSTTTVPLTQYRLALMFRDLGLYRSSILAAATLVGLSPARTTLDAPPFLAGLVYPTYYEDLILSNSLEEGLSPLLVFAIVRQESLFEGFATSTAYAHGLMQVIPSTGSAIAAQLGWPPGYETEDLYRPVVSVRFGTWYLAQQRDLFEGQLHVALAAYNGGPGNAIRWLEVSGDDPDLFFELLTLTETRLYLQLIREHYAVYSRLYRVR